MATRSAVRAVGGPAAWTADELEGSTDWWHAFTEVELGEIHAALEHARAADPRLDLAHLTPDEFPLPTVAGLVEAIQGQLVDGKGIMVCAGFPVDRYTLPELRAIWWGLSQHIGSPVAQSWRGDVLGDVRDIGTGIEGRAGRGYTSNVELRFHSDQADVTALFMLRRAKLGGESRWASSVAVHDEIARRRHDLLEVLYQPFTVSWQANEPRGERPWHEMPVYGRANDALACSYVGSNILWAEKNSGAPPLTPQQVEAVEYVAQVAAEPAFWVERTLEPGSVAFVHNHTVFHMRTAFEDFDEPDRKRHLLRTWLSLPNSRQLPQSFATLFRDVQAGATRGGYVSRDGRRRFETAGPEVSR
ncbi:MAG: TauD/TfdA family dioxygenase [Acidimicrobiales bacterium]